MHQNIQFTGSPVPTALAADVQPQYNIGAHPHISERVLPCQSGLLPVEIWSVQGRNTVVPLFLSSDMRLSHQHLDLPICRLFLAAVQQWLPVWCMILLLSPPPLIYPPLHG